MSTRHGRGPWDEGDEGRLTGTKTRTAMTTGLEGGEKGWMAGATALRLAKQTSAPATLATSGRGKWKSSAGFGAWTCISGRRRGGEGVESDEDGDGGTLVQRTGGSGGGCRPARALLRCAALRGAVSGRSAARRAICKTGRDVLMRCQDICQTKFRVGRALQTGGRVPKSIPGRCVFCLDFVYNFDSEEGTCSIISYAPGVQY